MEPFHPRHGSIPTLKFFSVGFTTKRAERRMHVFTHSAEASAGRKAVRGFTLTELMVVLAIIATITIVTIANQSSFNKTLILANTAYDIALTLRSAETYGIGSRAIGTVVNAGYGLHFETATRGSFTLFADSQPAPNANNCHGLPIGGASAPDAKPGNCIYDGPNSGEKVTTYELGNGMTISDFCVYTFGAWSCASENLLVLDVVFARPNPDPFINREGTKACLTISSPQGDSRFISVLPSGAITVDASSCP